MEDINISKKNIRYFKIAKKESEMSTYMKSYKIGCCAVYNNKVISVGHNQEKTTPLQFRYSIYYSRDNHSLNKKRYSAKAHAEIDCLHNIINRTDIQWSKVKLYIYRKCVSRPTGLARPCSCCMALIRELGIKHIYYTTDIGYSHEILL